MNNLTAYLQRVRVAWLPIDRPIKLAVTLIAAGYVLGWLIAPDRILGSSILWLELALPLILAAGLLISRLVGRTVLAVFLGTFFLVTAATDIAVNQPSLDKLKDRAIVGTALFEIYPLSGLGLGGYSYHYEQNAPKIIASPADNLAEPRLSFYGWWASGGLLALAGYILLAVEIFKRHRLLSGVGAVTVLLLIIGPAGSYPFRAIFFTVFWLVVALGVSKESNA